VRISICRALPTFRQIAGRTAPVTATADTTPQRRRGILGTLEPLLVRRRAGTRQRRPDGAGAARVPILEWICATPLQIMARDYNDSNDKC